MEGGGGAGGLVLARILGVCVASKLNNPGFI